MRIKGRTYRKGSLRVGESSGEDEERDWGALVKQVVDARLRKQREKGSASITETIVILVDECR